MPFFRHTSGNDGIQADEIFGKDFLRKQWTKAAEAIGLYGVSLYPGTKHTTATETAQLYGKQTALDASGLTNKAFERYCQVEEKGAFETVSAIHKKMAGKVVRLRKKRPK